MFLSLFVNNISSNRHKFHDNSTWIGKADTRQPPTVLQECPLPITSRICLNEGTFLEYSLWHISWCINSTLKNIQSQNCTRKCFCSDINCCYMFLYNEFFLILGKGQSPVLSLLVSVNCTSHNYCTNRSYILHICAHVGRVSN